MKKIVATKDLRFYPDQLERLKRLGEVKLYDKEATSTEEWLERCKGADIICTGMFGLKSDAVHELKDVFISLPFVGVEFLDIQKLRDQNIVVANAPGCNKEAVSEWIIGMLLMVYRKLDTVTNIASGNNILGENGSIWGKNVTILGKGNIGTHLGGIFESFGAKTAYYTRSENLHEICKNADIIINCLAANISTQKILDTKFFNSIQKGGVFISVSREHTYDLDALKNALQEERLAFAIDDCASAKVGDTDDAIYNLLASYKNMYVTPHIAWNAQSESRKANDIMIDNIEGWLSGKPINLIY